MKILPQVLEKMSNVHFYWAGDGVLLIICGIGYFVYDTSQKRKREREESESKIASLKSDFEGKLKDTSEQIRKAGRRGQTQSPTTSPEPVEIGRAHV